MNMVCEFWSHKYLEYNNDIPSRTDQKNSTTVQKEKIWKFKVFILLHTNTIPRCTVGTSKTLVSAHCS